MHLQPRHLRELFGKIGQLLAFDLVSSLPDELAELVFSNLEASSLCAAAQCSKHWRKIANSDKIWWVWLICIGCLATSAFTTSRHRLCLEKDCVLYENLPLPSWEGRSRPTSPRRKMHDISAIPCVLAPAMCHWKQVYMKASVLMSNWRYGVYSVAPLLRGHKTSITTMSVEGLLLDRVTGLAGKDRASFSRWFTSIRLQRR